MREYKALKTFTPFSVARALPDTAEGMDAYNAWLTMVGHNPILPGEKLVDRGAPRLQPAIDALVEHGYLKAISPTYDLILRSSNGDELVVKSSVEDDELLRMAEDGPVPDGHKVVIGEVMRCSTLLESWIVFSFVHGSNLDFSGWVEKHFTIVQKEPL